MGLGELSTADIDCCRIQPRLGLAGAILLDHVHASATVPRELDDVGTEAVGSSPVELDALTRQQFDLYREIVRNNKSLLGESP